RQTARDGGTGAKAIAAQIEKTEADLAQRSSPNAKAVHQRLKAAREAFVDVVEFIAANTRANPNAAFAGSVPYLMLAGNLVAGWQMARALMVAEDLLAQGTDAAFMQAKITTARFYADHLLSRAPGVRISVIEGAESVNALSFDMY
ncbi:acyl-CoA dehydrogenase C-terminal domain-containing protein, partial [Hydrogenophaga sp.]|uniref:acyl-CoA dehydrogenase C-terminal domain-containing protein n=1 Tax=Hydrogenophaga sp. TaxID=1904254 RepID=UPI0040353DBC